MGWDSNPHNLRYSVFKTAAVTQNLSAYPSIILEGNRTPKDILCVKHDGQLGVIIKLIKRKEMDVGDVERWLVLMLNY